VKEAEADSDSSEDSEDSAGGALVFLSSRSQFLS